MYSTEMASQMMSWISIYGPAALAGLLFLAALGAPAPASVAVMLAGALVRQDALDAPTAALMGLAGTVSGDALAYSLARFGVGLRSHRRTPSALWLRAQAIIDRLGGAGIYVTRWLITPPALAVTVLVGGSRYPFKKFMAYDLAGELTWIAIYGSLGYALGSRWEQAAALLATWSVPVLSAAAAGAVLAVLIHRCRKQKLAWVANPIV